MVWHGQPLTLCRARVGQPGAACLAAVSLRVADLQGREWNAVQRHQAHNTRVSMSFHHQGLADAHLALY